MNGEGIGTLKRGLRRFAFIIYAMATIAVAQAVQAAPPVIKIDGSSTVFPITEAVSEEFQSAQKGKVNVTVGISGTGGGFKKFCRGETDLQNASRPITASEMEACRQSGIKYIELPVAYDAMAVVVNSKNDWVKEISVEELKKMWAPEAQGAVTKWNQVNPKWPDQILKLFGAGADSGTFDYFTEAIVGKAKSSRGDYAASEDDNTLVQGVAGEKGSLGYIPFSYYEENKSRLKVLGIVNVGKDGKKSAAVLPSRQTVENGTYAPLSRPLFIYVSEASLKKTEVAEFMNFYIANVAKLAESVKYVPLPAQAYKIAADHLSKRKLGTIFGGEAIIGLKIEELLKREGKM